MAGNIRDLKELICISRMSMTSSAEECHAQSNCENSNSPGRLSDIGSPDSGFTNVSRNESDSDGTTKKATEDKNKTTSYDSSIHKKLRNCKKLTPLPNIKNAQKIKISKSDTLSGSKLLGSTSYEIILDNLDSEVVSNWLITLNAKIEKLVKWISDSTRFCDFCHFWLSVISKEDKKDALRIEYNLIVEDLKLAISPGVPQNRLMESKLTSLLKVAFHEYPEGFSGKKGDILLLNYLSILTSTEKNDYKQLLADIKSCITMCRQHVQNVLAIRSFALVNILNGVVKLFNKQNPQISAAGRKRNSGLTGECQINAKRILLAIKSSYVDVVNYLIESKFVRLDYKDDGDKSLIFHAVIANSHEVLRYLLRQLDESNGHLVNENADSGNSPLHAAANMGHVECSKELLNCPYIDVNVVNELCHGTTPLHLAIMHSRFEIVELLLKNGANPTLGMSGTSPMQLAKKFSKDSGIVKLLKDHL